MCNCVSFCVLTREAEGQKEKDVFWDSEKLYSSGSRGLPSFCGGFLWFFFFFFHCFFFSVSRFGFLTDLCFGFRTQPFREMRHNPTPRSRGVWRKTSSSGLPTVETSCGERSDLSAGAAWGRVTVGVFVPVVV